MLLVPCPNCGPRSASDFHYVGESKARPDTDTTTPEEWRDYLYIKDNPASWLKEVWYCRAGCRQFFAAERNTATNEFRDQPIPGSKLGGKA